MSTAFVQRTILKRLVADLLIGGFYIDVNDNDGDWETHLAKSRSASAIIKAVFNPNIDSADYCLGCFSNPTDENSFGMVRLIDGNGSTVISEYSISLEDHLKAANELASAIDDRGEDEWAADQFEAMERLQSAARDMVLCHSHPDHPEHDAWWAAHVPDTEDAPPSSAELKAEILARLSKAVDALGDA